ncbi:hypothetical protein ABT127_18720 [Streptomyces sp. NPDC001904]|uniref:hypothetical protein n=1 Tax=Streptomyces sp. NPDC001904 TaxID=3154531 RepID=UPI003322E450
MNEDYPFENGHNVSWELEGFGPDEYLCSSVTLTREQFLQVRGLFELGDDEWMLAGSYPVPAEVQGPLHAIVETAPFEDGVDYFLGAYQDHSSGF